MTLRTPMMLCLLVSLSACRDTNTRARKASPTPTATSAPAALVTPDSVALAAAAPASFHVVFVTSKGEVEIAVDRALSPHGADRLHYLVVNNFFTGACF
ncbi:MAG: hypothetical protein ABJC26_02885, partial [Gemmatimonadaceae bacterium]